MPKRPKRDRSKDEAKAESGESRVRLVRDSDGFLVIAGLDASGVNWDRLVDDMREESIRQIAASTGLDMPAHEPRIP